MIRLIGAGLIWGGSTLWGVQAAQSARQRVKVLEDIGQALELLERELSLKRTALPEVLEQLSLRKTQQGKTVFNVCRQLLETGESFEYAWSHALQAGGLNREDQDLLSLLSHVLGRYDARGQEQTLMRLNQEVERRCARQRETVSNLGRVYCMLGITAGGFLALTLL